MQVDRMDDDVVRVCDIDGIPGSLEVVYSIDEGCVVFEDISIIGILKEDIPEGVEPQEDYLVVVPVSVFSNLLYVAGLDELLVRYHQEYNEESAAASDILDMVQERR